MAAKIAHLFVDHEDVTLSKDGLWLSNGQEIEHQATCDAFFRNLKCDKSGYFIEIGRDQKRIQVEDTAFFVRDLEGTPQDGIEVILSDHTKVGLDPGTLKYKPGRLTCRVMTRLGEQEAKFLRAPYFELMKSLEEDENCYFLDFGGSKITLAKK